MTPFASLAVLWILNAAAPTSAEATALPVVETFGTIHALTQNHDLGPKIVLGKVLAGAHAYGLGSLSELRGEITILDGVAWLAYPPSPPRAPTAPRVVSVADSTEKAAFLVASHVLPPQWRTVSVPGALTSETLEITIERLLPQSQQEKGSLPRTFPFRIDGHFQNITLAIVDGRLLPADGRGEAAVGKANVLQPLKDVDGTLVGFFSLTDGAPFNHAHRHAHVHAIVPGRQATGHAQSFVLAPGAKLLMP